MQTFNYVFLVKEWIFIKDIWKDIFVSFNKLTDCFYLSHIYYII